MVPVKSGEGHHPASASVLAERENLATVYIRDPASGKHEFST